MPAHAALRAPTQRPAVFAAALAAVLGCTPAPATPAPGPSPATLPDTTATPAPPAADTIAAPAGVPTDTAATPEAAEPAPAACAVPRFHAPTRESPLSSISAAALKRAIREIVDAPPLDRTQWGIQVYDPVAGTILVDIDARKHFIPASNEKLLTTTAAIGVLGPGFRYATAIAAVGGSDTVPDFLVVHGSGDPTLSARFHADGLAPLDAIADSLYAAGIRGARDALVIDASYFDSAAVRPSWEVGDLDWYYAAPASAFAVSEAAIPISIAPGPAPGSPARVRFAAAEPVATIVNRLHTRVGAGSGAWRVTRLPGDTLLFTGDIDVGAAVAFERIAVLDPAAYAGRALAAALQRRGIAVPRGVRVARSRREAARLAAPGERVLARWHSPPLDSIVEGLLGPSQDWMAEQLLKTLGAERAGQGSWVGGLGVMRTFLTGDVGIDSLAIDLHDGSGLSTQNLVTPEALVRLLTYVRLQPWGQRYLQALASPAESLSTLQHRLLPLRCSLFAKTGTLTNVAALSGFLLRDDREIVFSILANGSGLPAYRVREAIDRVVTAIARQAGTD